MAKENQAAAPFIVCLPNGPYYLSLDPTPLPIPYVRSAQGEPCATGRGWGLCRCGAAQSKPFGDGSQWGVGFSDGSE